MRHDADKKEPVKSGCLDIFIVAVIVLVLAAIALPDFIKFKVRTNTEAKTLLHSIFVSQIEYRRDHGTFAQGPVTFSLLQWTPARSTLYAYFCDDDYLPNTKREVVSKDTRLQYSSLLPASSAAGFTCLAIGNYDDDPDLDVWSINDARDFRLIHDDTR